MTIRMPKDLHDALRTEAHERRTSMNRLCLEFLYGALVASDNDAGAEAADELGLVGSG